MQIKLYLFNAIIFGILLYLIIYIYYNISSSGIERIIRMNKNNKNNKNNTNENFIANSNITNQEPMNFKYLTNADYARDILATYYLDDDTKIKGQRTVIHPYMYSNNNNYGNFWWSPKLSTEIYSSSGVRL